MRTKLVESLHDFNKEFNILDRLLVDIHLSASSCERFGEGEVFLV